MLYTCQILWMKMYQCKRLLFMIPLLCFTMLPMYPLSFSLCALNSYDTIYIQTSPRKYITIKSKSKRLITFPLVLMVSNCLSNLQHKSHHLKLGPSCWTAWTGDMMAIWWTKTQTTNITNDVGVAVCSSTCIGHLQCQNWSCDYLQRAHHASKVNNMEFEGFIKYIFFLSSIVSFRSNTVCMIYKNLPNALHFARQKSSTCMGKSFSHRACIHIGTHQHPVKVGDFIDNRERINALIEEHVQCMPQATHNNIAFETNKDMVGEFILCSDNNTHHLFSLKDLKLVFGRCRELYFPNLCSKVTFLNICWALDGIA